MQMAYLPSAQPVQLVLKLKLDGGLGKCQQKHAFKGDLLSLCFPSITHPAHIIPRSRQIQKHRVNFIYVCKDKQCKVCQRETLATDGTFLFDLCGLVPSYSTL